MLRVLALGIALILVPAAAGADAGAGAGAARDAARAWLVSATGVQTAESSSQCRARCERLRKGCAGSQCRAAYAACIAGCR